LLKAVKNKDEDENDYWVSDKWFYLIDVTEL
jgi:hypothetical protein